MKITVISDTHLPRRGKWIPDIVFQSIESSDLIIHAGDFTSYELLIDLQSIKPFEGVTGNNDGPEILMRLGKKKIVQYGGYYIGIIHGDGAYGTTIQRVKKLLRVITSILSSLATVIKHIKYGIMVSFILILALQQINGEAQSFLLVRYYWIKKSRQKFIIFYKKKERCFACELLVYTKWQDQNDYDTWKTSEAFQRAHQGMHVGKCSIQCRCISGRVIVID